MTGSNCRHSACKADALPTELITLSSRSVGVYYIHLKLCVKPFLQKIEFISKTSPKAGLTPSYSEHPTC